MPRRALMRIMLAVVIGMAVWAPASMATAADPCCQIGLNGVPSQLIAGGDAQMFTSNMRFTAQGQLRNVSAVFTFQTNNLSGSQIQLARQQNGGSWHGVSVSRRNGELMATDRFDVQRQGDNNTNADITSQYRISFGAKVPPQTIRITVTLVASGGNGSHGQQQQLAQAGPYQISVVSSAPPPTPTEKPTPTVKPTPTPTVTPTADAPSALSNPSGAAAPVGAAGDAGSGGGGGMWIAYIVGGLLLIAGIGVIGTMLWKRGPHAATAGWEQEPVRHGAGPAYPTQAYGTAPTQTYGAPDQAYGAPDQTYGTATQTYGAATQTYGSATQAYGAPTEAYGPSAQAYGPPTQAYGSGAHSYDPAGQAPTAYSPPPPPPGGRPPVDPTRQMPPL